MKYDKIIRGVVIYEDSILKINVSGCPHDCTNCENEYKFVQYGEPLKDKILDIINYLFSVDIQQIIIGGGEPLSNRNSILIAYIIDLIKNNRAEIPIVLESNFSLKDILSKDKMNESIQCILDRIDILKLQSIKCNENCKSEDCLFISLDMNETNKQGKIVEYIEKENPI